MRAVILASLATFVTASGSAGAEPRQPGQCFLRREYQSFRPVNDHAFNIRVGVRTYYRIELEGQCPNLNRKDSVLITTFRSTGPVCDPLDWDLKVAQSGELRFASGCIVKSQTRFTDQQAAAIPFNEKP